jgi:hypothetical protein
MLGKNSVYEYISVIWGENVPAGIFFALADIYCIMLLHVFSTIQTFGAFSPFKGHCLKSLCDYTVSVNYS